MRHTKADFGGISYTEGDFHTPGTSGLGEMSKADFGGMGEMGFRFMPRKIIPVQQQEQNKLNALRSSLAVAQNERAMLKTQLTRADGSVVSIENQIAAMKKSNPALSGMGSLGFSINDAFSTIFGENAALVKQNLQTSATNVAQQTISSNLQTNPNAKQGIIDTTKEAVGAVIKEYGIIIYPVAGLSALALGYGLYNMFKRK